MISPLPQQSDQIPRDPSPKVHELLPYRAIVNKPLPPTVVGACHHIGSPMSIHIHSQAPSILPITRSRRNSPLVHNYTPVDVIVLGRCSCPKNRCRVYLSDLPQFRTQFYKECGCCSSLRLPRLTNCESVRAGYILTKWPVWEAPLAAISPARHGRSMALVSWAPSFVCK